MSPGNRPKGPISRILAVGASSLVTCVVLHGLAGAQTIANGNATITFNLGTSAGMNSWTVDGNNELNQQWFWFRIGNSGPQLDLSQITTTPFTSFLGTKQMTAIYSNAQYEVDLNYTLGRFSNGSGKSQLSESISFINKTGNALDLHFYMYSDFTLGGASFANSQNLLLGNTVGQTSTNSWAIQTVTGTGASNNVAINSPVASEMEVSAYPQLYNELTSSNGYTLNNVSAGGPGHETWGMEWDAFLGAFGSGSNALSQISITDTMQVPEPGFGLFAIVGVAAGALCANRRKRIKDA